MLNLEKTVDMSDFISYAVSLLWAVSYGHFTKKCAKSRLFIKWCISLNLQAKVDQFFIECLFYAT